jgi:hypothetical protein
MNLWYTQIWILPVQEGVATQDGYMELRLFQSILVVWDVLLLAFVFWCHYCMKHLWK